MADAGIFMSWDRPAPGQGTKALDLYKRLTTYLTALHAEGRVASWEPVLLSAHGGQLGGFLLIRGKRENLDLVRESSQFREIMVRGNSAMLRFRVVRAHFGEEAQEIMNIYQRVELEK